MVDEEKETLEVLEEEEEQDSEEPDKEKKEKEDEDAGDIVKRIDRLIGEAIDKRFPHKKPKTTPKHIREKEEEESESQIEDGPTCYRCHGPLVLTEEGYYLCVKCRKLYNV